MNTPTNSKEVIMNNWYIPESYRTRGQRYDDLLTRRQPVQDRLGSWLWDDNAIADRVAVGVCVLAVGYFVAALVRALF